VNTELGATGVLVQDNRAPLPDGVRGYLVWAEGSDHTYIGNSMANSTIEHCIRASKRTYADGTYSILNRVLVGHNGLRNPPLGGTDSKGGTVTFRDVRNAYIHGNSLYHGPIQIGNNNDPPTENVVVDGNTVEHEYKPTEGIGHIQVHAGARKVMIRNNVIKQVHGSLHPSIQLTGTSTGVTTDDVRVMHNTNITDSEGGAFITLSQPATNVQLLNNLNVALRPSNVLNVQVGHSDGTGTGMSSFSLIDGNVWAPRRGDQGSSDEPLAVVKVLTDYKTVAEWNALGQVGTDHRTAVSLSSSLTPTTSAADVSARRPGAPFDWNRRLRPASNATAGAVQRGSESELISGPWADSTGTYTLVNSGEAVGKAAYSDRGYTYTSVPASIASFPFIRTANDDKNVTLSEFLYFDLGAPADVFVVYDSRATTLPTWLGDGSWADTGETVTISSGDTFRVFKKHYIGGTVVLGGNKAGGGSGAGNNYTVFIEAAPW
jgi:hypothetical protein